MVQDWKELKENIYLENVYVFTLMLNYVKILLFLNRRKWITDFKPVEDFSKILCLEFSASIRATSVRFHWHISGWGIELEKLPIKLQARLIHSPSRSTTSSPLHNSVTLFSKETKLNTTKSILTNANILTSDLQSLQRSSQILFFFLLSL